MPPRSAKSWSAVRSRTREARFGGIAAIQIVAKTVRDARQPVGYGLVIFAALPGISRFEVFERAGTVGVLAGVAAFAAGTRGHYLRVEP
jgi:hypothetical protein